MHTIAIIRGDGIGPEICDATQSVLEAAGARLFWKEAPMGEAALREFGTELPEESLETVRTLRMALKAPLVARRCCGGVVLGSGNGERRYPSVNNGLRRELGIYANLRPVRGWKGISGRYGAMDLAIVRETTEDVYIGIEREVAPGWAEAVKRVTRGASERVARFACDYARKAGRKRVTAVHKANVLHLTDGLFLETARAVAAGYPELEFDDRMIDAACYHMVKQPEIFDVILAPNQYGDILSDLAAGLVGSLGLAPGGNFGDAVAMFEASHGAAPDIAGKGIVNPISLILSGAMMLEHAGEAEAAGRVWRAVRQVLEDGRALTPDLGGTATTREITAAIVARIGDG